MNNFYYRLPSIVQDALVTLKGWHVKRQRTAGLRFQAFLQGYLERDSWDGERLRAYQLVRLSEALERASRTVFYKKLFQSLGADWRDFVDANALSELPIITKADMNQNPEDFMPRDPLRTDRLVSTSGTSGRSFRFPISSNVEFDQWAVWWRYRLRHGIKPGMSCALFASAPILPAGQTTKRPYRLNLANNEVRFSIFHISSSTIASYIEAFKKYKLKWVHGNPTAIAHFCQTYLAAGFHSIIEIDHLTVGSENLTPWQVDAMRRVFGRKPRQHYGLAEGVANFSELPDGRIVVDEDFSFVEFLDTKDQSVKRIVGTAFSNEAFCFLRYDTGDLCSLATDKGASEPRRIIGSLDGRSTDYICLPGGRRVASLAGPFHATAGLAGAQIVQDSSGALKVLYVPGHDWQGEAALKPLELELRKRIGFELSISFECVDSIPTTERRKSRLVVSSYSG